MSLDVHDTAAFDHMDLNRSFEVLHFVRVGELGGGESVKR